MPDTNEMDAFDLLKADHREVSALFEKFEHTTRDSARAEVVDKICEALTMHATLEEKVFYPASRDVLSTDDEAIVDEAVVEHGSLKDLIRKLRAAKTHNARFDATVRVLKEYVEHHVKEEEAELFPKLRRGGVDAQAVGAELRELKAQLTKKSKASR